MLKASFLLFLTFLLFINFNTVCVDAQAATTSDSDDGNADTDTDSATDTNTASDDGDDDDDDSDSMSATGDSDDDSDDDDDDSDSMSATGDSDDSDDDDSDDDNSGDDSTSGDSDDDDSTSGTSDDDDSTPGESDTDSSDNSGGSGTATTQAATQYCASLTSNECANAYANDGTAICAVNAVSQNCYAVVASAGIYGSGNYDDGFTAAQQSAEAESQKLNTIVGVLAGIITVMALGIIGGAYYLHTKSKRMVQEQELETVQSTTAMETADAEPML